MHFNIFDNILSKGANGNLIKVMISMYSKLENYVKISDTSLNENKRENIPRERISGPLKCNIGTRQGDVNSPSIFNLYINDLIGHLRKTCNGVFITTDIPDILCLLFADDVACGADTVHNLQLQLNAVSEFCNISGMSVNLSKTEIMVFRNGGPLRHSEKWTYNGVNVFTRFIKSLFCKKIITIIIIRYLYYCFYYICLSQVNDILIFLDIFICLY